MSENDALSAIDELNGSEIDGRPIKVNKARPKPTGTGSNYKH
jgi:RNA recognition motif-containing protein